MIADSGDLSLEKTKMTKILVIEDEAILREEIGEWLLLEGYTAVVAEDGMVGVEAAFRHLPDLIVCDILMPHLDGYGVLLEIHSNPATVEIPFIFLTAKAAHAEIRKGMDLGADDYITKPFTRLELLQAIEARLAKKNKQTQVHQYELTQLQQALTQANEHAPLRAKLISMFTHDFANSLTSILMTNSLLRSYVDGMEPTRRLGHLNRIESSVHLLLQMLDDLLIIAQIETGKLTLTPTMVNVHKFLQDIEENCHVIYGTRCQLLLESRKSDMLWIDTRLLRLIATNLLTHAIRSSPKGGTVRFLLDSNSEECILTIQEQNTTISEADCLRIFTILQQHSNVDNVAVVGLELAIVKQAVSFQGGSIQFNSQSGVGTTITVNIPTLQDEDVINDRKLLG